MAKTKNTDAPGSWKQLQKTIDPDNAVSVAISSIVAREETLMRSKVNPVAVAAADLLQD